MTVFFKNWGGMAPWAPWLGLWAFRYL